MHEDCIAGQAAPLAAAADERHSAAHDPAPTPLGGQVVTMTSVQPRGPSLRRGVLWGLLAAVVVAVAGSVAKESLGTIALFSAGSALFVGFAGYKPPVERTEADRMSWLFRLVFRRIGRG